MEQVVTTVKLNQELYNQFKELNIRGKISFQDFVNKCLEKYLSDIHFQTEISESISQKLSYNQPFQFSTLNKDK
jgi:predicted CopG family antitoxin